MLFLNSVCPGYHTLQVYPKDSIATDSRLCFGSEQHLIHAESLAKGSYVPNCKTVQNTTSDVSQIKPEVIVKLCFSDGIVTNKWGSETAGYALLIDYVHNHMALISNVEAFLQSSDNCRLCNTEY